MRGSASLIAAVGCVGLLVSSGCKATHACCERDDEVVALAEVPAAVRATIEQHVGTGQIKQIERSFDHGRETYDVEIAMANGEEAEFEVAPDGTFLGMDTEDEDEDNDDDR